MGTDSGLLIGHLRENLKDPNNWELVSNEYNSSIDAMRRIGNGFAFILNQNIYKVIYDNDAFQYEQLEVQTPVGFSDFIIDEDDFIWGLYNKKVYSQKNNFNPILQVKFFMILH